MITRIVCLTLLTGLPAFAEPNLNPAPVPPAATPPSADAVRAAQQAEQARNRCIEERRYIAGRVLQVLPEGLIVDSGYSKLLSAPFNRSWLVKGTATVARDANAIEEKKPDALCVGAVLLANIPKRPPVKPYDYVVMHGYPAGDFIYSPVPGIQKTVRRFSASLARAVEANLARESK